MQTENKSPNDNLNNKSKSFDFQKYLESFGRKLFLQEFKLAEKNPKLLSIFINSIKQKYKQ